MVAAQLPEITPLKPPQIFIAPGRDKGLQQTARARDVAVWSQTARVLPPLSDTDPPKGIGEVVMIPVAGAMPKCHASAPASGFVLGELMHSLV